MDLKKASYTILGADLFGMVLWYFTKAMPYSVVLYLFMFTLSSFLTFLASLTSFVNYNKYKNKLFLVYVILSAIVFCGIAVDFIKMI